MLTYRYPLIAREGWPLIAAALALALVVHYLFDWLALPLWLLAALLVFLFRDPPRAIPAKPLGIVSPVCGRVEWVGEVSDGYLQRRARCITLRMGLIDVYSLRSPMEGRILQQWGQGPPAFRAQEARARSGASAFAHWVQSDEKDDVVLVVEAGGWLLRPRCYAHNGERIGQGQRCGHVRFGARVHVLLPDASRVVVAAGDRVTAGADIIAHLVHAAATAPRVGAV